MPLGGPPPHQRVVALQNDASEQAEMDHGQPLLIGSNGELMPLAYDGAKVWLPVRGSHWAPSREDPTTVDAAGRSARSNDPRADHLRQGSDPMTENPNIALRWENGQVAEDWGFAFDQYGYDEFWS